MKGTKVNAILIKHLKKSPRCDILDDMIKKLIAEKGEPLDVSAKELFKGLTDTLKIGVSSGEIQEAAVFLGGYMLGVMTCKVKD